MLLTNEENIAAVNYLLKLIRKRASNDSMTSLHMVEGTRRNFNKLVNHILACPEIGREIKSALMMLLSAKLLKNLDRLKAKDKDQTKAGAR